MLYDRWLQIAAARPRDFALRDLAAGRMWTFAQLMQAAAEAPVCRQQVVYPQGHTAEFVLTVLRAWRCRLTVCPLEPGQAPPVVPQPPSHCVHLKFTSATTGKPRLVAFTASQLAADVDNIVATMGLRQDCPNVAVISLAHSYGFSNLVLPLLLHGIPLILAPSPLPQLLRQAAEGHSAITLPAVPALWRAWQDAASIPRNVRLAISAGAPLPAALEWDVFRSSGLKIHNFYGSTECGGIAFDATPQPRTDDRCVGRSLRNVQLSVNDEGCVRVRSEAVGETYWPEPSEELHPGCFQTADLAEIKEHTVYLCGRLSDRINVAGRKVSPETIEQGLREHPAVRECLVFGVPSEQGDRTELIVACVSARSEVTGEILRQFLLERLPAWQVPRHWWFEDDLGANVRGKLSRAEWRKRFLQRQAGGNP